MGNSLIKELCHSNIIVSLSEELSNGDVVLKELGHSCVEVLAQCVIKEFSYSDIVGAAGSMQELSHSHVVVSLVEELGDSDVVGLKELSDSGIKVVR